MKHLLLLLVWAFFTGSCARSYYFQPAAEQNANTEVMHSNGIPYIQSVLEKAEVSVLMTARGEQNINLDLLCYNDGGVPFDLKPEQIRVTGYSPEGIPAPFRVFSAEQYIRRRNTRNALISGAVLAVSIAGVIALGETGGGAASSVDGLVWGLSTVAPLALNSAQSSFYVPDDGLARPHTLLPAAGYRGTVMVRGKKDHLHRVEIMVPVNGLSHRFDFERRTRRF